MGAGNAARHEMGGFVAKQMQTRHWARAKLPLQGRGSVIKPATVCSQMAPIDFDALKERREGMVVCICNRLTDTMIAAAVADGARTQADVFRRFHLRRGCSSCSVRIADAIERAKSGSGITAAE